jgi:hypothetical protein
LAQATISVYGFLDYQYLRVFIQSCEAHPELAGHEALIQVEYCKVFDDGLREDPPSAQQGG